MACFSDGKHELDRCATALLLQGFHLVKQAIFFAMALALNGFMFFSGFSMPAQAQVVINEIAVANSDRLLQRNQPGYPRLGIAEQWTSAHYNDTL